MVTVRRILPALVLMAVIFAVSAQHNVDSGSGVFGLFVRKCGHATEYALLFWLWLRVLHWRRALGAATIAVTYAVTDELHQHFVTGRVGSPYDVLIDSGGVAIAWAVWRGVRALRRRRRPPSLDSSRCATGNSATPA
jgi:VanZ family protein